MLTACGAKQAEADPDEDVLCVIENVKLVFSKTPKAASKYCFDNYKPVHDGTSDAISVGTTINGCAAVEERELVAQFTPGTVFHEANHFAEKYCSWLTGESKNGKR